MSERLTTVDVTDQCQWDNPDDEFLPLLRCVCGHTFVRWTMTLSIYPNEAHQMPCCGRRLYFVSCVRILEVQS